MEGASSIRHECILSVVAQLSNKNANHPKCAFADSESSVLTGMMVSLVPVYKTKIPRPVQLSDPVEFESFDHLYHIKSSNRLLSKAKDFETVPAPRAECRIMQFDKGSRHKQYVNCPEQDCENLVYHYDQLKSMIEFSSCTTQMNGETVSK